MRVSAGETGPFSSTRHHHRRQVAALCASLALGVVSAAAQAASPELPLKRVVLSSAGVGYFEHETTVDGPGELPLTVRLDQVDDVLKSLVVLDESGGVAEVTLPGREGARDLFRDLPFDDAALASPAALLATLRGAEVRLSGARRLEGRVIAVSDEIRTLPNDAGQVTRHRVSVLTKSGIEQAILEEADAVEFADTALQAQIGKALGDLLALRAQDTRTLKLRLTGTGKRAVRVGYVVDVPLWKAAYRLVMPADPAATTAHLQGWAVFENMSGHDWNNVELTLVSGNPVTFRQALYATYRVRRPEVPVEVMGRVLPPADSGTMPEMMREIGQAAKADMAPPAPAPMMAASVAGAPRARSATASAGTTASAPATLAGTQAAETQEATTQVLFTLPAPVSARAGTSIVAPIIDREAPTTRLSLYQPGVNSANPLAALKLINKAENALPPGVLSIYDTGPSGLAFVGDARLQPLPAGEERLLSFAVDQKTAIQRESAMTEARVTGKIAKGVLQWTVVDRQVTTYRIKAPVNEARQIVIEHPRSTDWRLVTPEEKSVELTRTAYRIARDMKAGESTVVEVVIERPRVTSVELAKADVDVFIRRIDLDPPLRAALARIVELRAATLTAQGKRDRLAEEREGIVTEQGRIRENLRSVTAGSDLHKRYLDQLKKQEDTLDRLDGDIKRAKEESVAADSALNDYIAKLTI